MLANWAAQTAPHREYVSAARHDAEIVKHVGKITSQALGDKPWSTKYVVLVVPALTSRGSMDVAVISAAE
jgi:hypothetical protein